MNCGLLVSLSLPEKSLHKKVFQNRKMSIINERPNNHKGGKVSAFSESFKVQVALEYLDGGYSYLQLGKKHVLPATQIRTFVIWYRKKQDQFMPAEAQHDGQEFLGATSEKELEKKLALAEMKIAALEKVIAIANEKYGTDLKKKAATK